MHRPTIPILVLALTATGFACADGEPPEEAGEPATEPVAPAGTLAPAPGDTAPAAAASRDTLSATLRDTGGDEVGRVTLTGTPNGLLVEADLDGVPTGEHAFHLHETGACEPDFEAAGGHLNPDGGSHGILSAGGPHAGDMPNIHVPRSTTLTVEVVATGASIEALTDGDGSAVVIHDGPDDYATDPAGDAGDRIACGVVERRAP